MSKRSKIPISKTHPNLMSEWDFCKNKLRPEEVTHGSHKKVWWVCAICKHGWLSSVCKRTAGRCCPACAGKIITENNSLAFLYPHLIEEWSVKNVFKPEDVSPGSHKKIWWVCKYCGHEWRAFIFNRALHGSGCPACAGRVVTKNNNLTVNFPELAKEWSNRNRFLPDKATPMSHKKVWWECSDCKYEWEAHIFNRTFNNSDCPACAGMAVSSKNNLEYLYSEIALEWAYDKNGSLSPKDVTPGSDKKVWWVCSECAHERRATINKRTSGRGCPACAGRAVSSKNNLEYLYPEIALEWDYDKNENMFPSDFTPGSNKKVWWVCSTCGYNWEAFVFNRVTGRGCPACAGKVATKNNNLAIKFADLIKEWSNENKFEPEEVTPYSHKKVTWVCLVCKHSWSASVSSRARGNGCPECAKTRRIKTLEKTLLSQNNNLAFLYPSLVKEWSLRNSIKPEEVTPGSHKKVWWVCSVCEHEWRAIVNSRTSGSGCPACAGKTATEKNNLAFFYPELVKEWSTLNILGPDKITCGSEKKVWWLCSICSYEWVAAVNKRSAGGGCPKCARGNVSLVSQKWLDSLNIEIREYFIKELGLRVDGYDPEIKTVYEFLGDYWHGNPEVYSSSDINQCTKKSFGQLYEETLSRLRLLEEAGFKVIYIWENDYKNILI